MVRCVEATFDFVGTDAGQLSFVAGDIVHITHEGARDEWWEGMLHGEVGWFPSNFCSEPYDEGIEEEEDDDDDWGTDAIKAVALYAYDATSPDELSFQPGDVIEVTENSQAWWTGSVRGSPQGVFPANFVEILADADVSPEASGNSSGSGGTGGGLLDLSKVLGERVAKARLKDGGSTPRSTDGGSTPRAAASGGSAPTATAAAAAAIAGSAAPATFVVGSHNASNWAAEEKVDGNASEWAAESHSDLGGVGCAPPGWDAAAARHRSRHRSRLRPRSHACVPSARQSAVRRGLVRRACTCRVRRACTCRVQRACTCRVQRACTCLVWCTRAHASPESRRGPPRAQVRCPADGLVGAQKGLAAGVAARGILRPVCDALLRGTLGRRGRLGAHEAAAASDLARRGDGARRASGHSHVRLAPSPVTALSISQRGHAVHSGFTVHTLDVLRRGTECAAGSLAAVGVGRVASALTEAQRIVTAVPTVKLTDEAMLSFLGQVPCT